jgi:hypothetical protein
MRFMNGFLFRLQAHERGVSVEHAVTFEHLALMAEVDVRDLDLLQQDVLPHVHLRPVADREGAEVFARTLAAVVDVPQLGALVLGVPLAEFVAVTEHPFFRTCLLLVPTATADGAVHFEFFQAIQQGDRLQLVAARIKAGLFLYPTRVNTLLYTTNEQVRTVFLHQHVAEGDSLLKVVARVHMEQVEGHFRRMEGLTR